MELELTDDQEIFAGATRKFLEESVPVAELRARRADPIAFDRDYWRQGAELGWTSLLASEADGGGSISDHELSDLGLLVSRTLPLERVAAIKTGIVATLKQRWPGMELTLTANPRALDDESVLERVRLIAMRRWRDTRWR